MPTTFDLLDEGKQALRLGDLPRAEQIARQIVQLDPHDLEGMHLLAVTLRRLGKLAESVERCLEVLRLDPQHADVHNDLGIALARQGRLTEAIPAFERFVQLKPEVAEAHHNLGNALRLLGRTDEAISCLQAAVRLKPDYAEAYANLGTALHALGRWDEAITALRQVVHLKPSDTDAHERLAHALRQQGKSEEALIHRSKVESIKAELSGTHHLHKAGLGAQVYSNGTAAKNQIADVKVHESIVESKIGADHFSQGRMEEAQRHFLEAVRLNPTYAEAHNNLGTIYSVQGRLEEAVISYQEAIRLNPSYAEAYNNLGIARLEQGRVQDAFAACSRAVELKPTYAEAHNIKGLSLAHQGRTDEAIASYQEALRLNPNISEGYNNLANAWKDQGQIDNAIECYRQACKLNPQEPISHSNLVLNMLYHPGFDSRAIYEEQRRYETQHAKPMFAPPNAYPNDRSPERRLRIGYVSADLRNHIIGCCVWPLMRNHDHEQFEIFCYVNQTQCDNITEKFQQNADHWCKIIGWSDQRVVDKIRHDGIDILVDLSMHTHGNRLPIFAHKAAPVQATYNYPGSTGLRSIDYRLTDPYLDPPGTMDEWYSEQSYRLPHSFWCYDPPVEEAITPVQPLPALKNGFVTFGCLNNFAKVNDRVLELWSKVLHAVDRSRMTILSHHGSQRQRALGIFERHGIAANRISFEAYRPRTTYLGLYNQFDIGLDAFPYNGHTTSLDSYWMGVPVITLIGNTVVGRAGFSQLKNLHLEEWAATTPAHYVQLAVDLAADLPRLEAMRADLRERMKQSPLMDAVGFAKGIEQAYRNMWRIWCTQQNA